MQKVIHGSKRYSMTWTRKRMGTLAAATQYTANDASPPRPQAHLLASMPLALSLIRRHMALKPRFLFSFPSPSVVGVFSFEP